MVLESNILSEIGIRIHFCALKYHEDLEKQGDPRDCFVLLTVTPLWQMAQCVSRAPTR